MIYSLSTGDYNYIDFIGEVGRTEVLAAMFDTARKNTRDFLGFKFYQLPCCSPNGPRIEQAAALLELDCYTQNDESSVAVDLRSQAGAVRTAVRRSMLKREVILSQPRAAARRATQ